MLVEAFIENNSYFELFSLANTSTYFYWRWYYVSMKSRYNFTKNIYKDYVVLIYRKKKYYSYDKDKIILDYIGFNNKLYILRKYNINFIILDDLELIGIVHYKINNYYKYLFISYIDCIIKEIRRRKSSE